MKKKRKQINIPVRAGYVILRGFEKILDLTTFSKRRMQKNRKFNLTEEEKLFKADESAVDGDGEKGGRHTKSVIYKSHLINGQSTGIIKDFKFGSAVFSDVGCGIIATYNALRLAGKNVRISDISSDYERMGAMVIKGLWGANPFMIEKELKKYGVESEKYADIREMEAEVSGKRKSLLILSFWNNRKNVFSGAHTVAIIADRDQKTTYTVCNRFSNYDNYVYCKKLSQTINIYEKNGKLLTEGRLIIGLVLQTKNMGNF